MSLLIKGAQIVDGAGRKPYGADLLVQGKVISAIGKLTRRRARKEIDGLGNYLAPGFIDVNTTADHELTLFTDPEQNVFTWEGVTTIIGGQDGASLAPLLYGSLESIRKWADPTEINVNWHTVNEFLKTLERFPLGVNFGTLVGHSTIRRALVGEVDRPLTIKELKIFEHILARAMKEGAFGLSTGLGYAHARSTTPREIKALVKVVAQQGGVYSTRLKEDPAELVNSVKDAIKISRETGAKTIISGFTPLKSYGARFDEALTLIEKSAARANVYLDIEPQRAQRRAIYTLLPQALQRGSLETMTEALQDKKVEALVKKEWQKTDFPEMRVVGAVRHPYLLGREIQKPEELFEIMLVTKLRTSVALFNVDEEKLHNALASSRALVAGAGAKAFKNRGLPIETAIKKIAYEPAALLGIKQKGVIKERNAADLVIIGKSDHKVRQTILGGKVVGEERIKGEVLRHRT